MMGMEKGVVVVVVVVVAGIQRIGVGVVGLAGGAVGEEDEGEVVHRRRLLIQRLRDGGRRLTRGVGQTIIGGIRGRKRWRGAGLRGDGIGGGTTGCAITEIIFAAGIAQ